ncbi:hypothetical protein SAMN05518672_102157 [Chitinophaga sp. CF118]|uniref:hypothetical protein n=1 Tax=Chitinophaga sp. CF118 TaxID=1884367 RepID=UPI0008EA2A57|nr:hypothetical protein [Chitinophaga sp. CF118]SFD49077.1 hypothetical protein SAMN05518672_102157 [Chitinophaga sp. CF118]
MRNQLSIVTACLSLFSFVACTSTKKAPATTGELVTNISVQQPVKVGSPLMLTFTVSNTSGKELKFCKWHTPFEGFKNSYFNIKNSNGEEVRYKGIMAKRIMPPPADAYTTVPAGKSVTVSIDLLKAYDVAAAGKYQITYDGSGMSGLEKVNEATFIVTE